MQAILPWPAEAAQHPTDSVRRFSARGSNLVLDLHGDPATAGLAVFSDGNHHMALEAAVRLFLETHPSVNDVFYTTTPPAPLVDALKGDGLVMGNLRISRKPDLFIGPGNILDGLIASGYMNHHIPFAQSRGNVILVRKGNPKSIATVADLLSDEVTVACSNPITEKASFNVYIEAASVMAKQAGISTHDIVAKLSHAGLRTVHSQVIHHREVPELIASGAADAAIIYYHLALRYTRVFADVFEYVDVTGVTSADHLTDDPTTRYHIGKVKGAGQWAQRFLEFMQGPSVQTLYEQHGLIGVG